MNARAAIGSHVAIAHYLKFARKYMLKSPKLILVWWKVWLHKMDINAVESLEMPAADFVQEPMVVIPHQRGRRFIGQKVIRRQDGKLMMILTSGRPPADFSDIKITELLPELHVSVDNGRTWEFQGQMNIDWNLPGMISDGGVSLLYLQDGRLGMVANRNVPDMRGGGAPVFSTSLDDGKTWQPARRLIESDDIYYVMNDRLRQLSGGRLILPVAHLPELQDRIKYTEGDICEARCFYSDDGGEKWNLSPYDGRALLPDDIRGMAEPAVEILDDGRLIMLARTGKGCLCRSFSEDGGLHWSTPSQTTLTSPCSSLALKSTGDGRLIVVYNHCEPLEPGSFFPRTLLAYAFSTDGGTTWSDPRCIDNSGQNVIENRFFNYVYPDVCLVDDGILVTYSSHMSQKRDGFLQPGGGAFSGEGIKSAIIRYE